MVWQAFAGFRYNFYFTIRKFCVELTDAAYWDKSIAITLISYCPWAEMLRLFAEITSIVSQH